MKWNKKKMLAVTAAILGTAFVIMRYLAKKQYPESVYADQPEEQNPLENKKVIFIENEHEPPNADGFCGHLEIVGETDTVRPTVYEQYIKRGLDVILSFFGMVVLAPVYVITAAAIKIDDPGSVLFYQKRAGKNKKFFRLTKFRSMKLNTPKNVPTHQLKNPEQYLLRTGKLIRRTSIDELPQLFDIFVGNMSIIGPRPALWNQEYLISERDKYHANDVKPGLTGLAQISGRDELEISKKAKLDGVYVKALRESSITGFLMDVKLFVGSFFVVLKSTGFIEGGTGQIAKEIEKADEL